MKKKLFTLITLSMLLFNTNLYSQTLTWQQCGSSSLSTSGSPTNFNNSKTFTGVALSSTDVQIAIGILGCNPVSTNAGGIKLNGTTFIESNVPVQNCGVTNAVANNFYTISQSVFNQAVIDGGGTIVFSNYIKDTCSPGVGCSFVNDPCINMTVSYSVLSNESFEKSGFLVYPNPVKDVLNLSSETTIISASIFDLLGQELATKNINASEATIDVNNLQSGTYFVKIYCDAVVKTWKIIKE
ncbi:T9SS type A sorting domain-containing protein [Flavobacterium mekongense]|uniref:T9SS type A sorting domain-containing protein n=1 Tax=Flavobacterium mekongense TaxID=3379707 RepID=UPI00399A90EA